MHVWLLTLCFIILSGCADDPKIEQFTIENETALDKESELMWATTDNREDITWQDAVDYCESYSSGGFQDWRMPTQKELQSLIEAKINGSGEVINLSGNLIWTSEIDDSKGAFCNLKKRTCFWMEQVISISLRALPVRDTKAEPAENSSTSFAPAPRPQSIEQRLQMLELLRKQDLITNEEYTSKKTAILDEL